MSNGYYSGHTTSQRGAATPHPSLGDHSHDIGDHGARGINEGEGCKRGWRKRERASDL